MAEGAYDNKKQWQSDVEEDRWQVGERDFQELGDGTPIFVAQVYKRDLCKS